jgi:hypothetical protein
MNHDFSVGGRQAEKITCAGFTGLSLIYWFQNSIEIIAVFDPYKVVGSGRILPPNRLDKPSSNNPCPGF